MNLLQAHRFPTLVHDHLEFVPNYALRYLAAWALGITTIVCWILTLLHPVSMLEWTGIPVPVAARLADALFFGTLSASMLYLRGQYLCWDPKVGAVMYCSGFSGIRGQWTTQCPYSPDGEVMFEYCQAELQSLCVFSYRPNPGEAWLLLHIYTNWDQAHAVADFLRSWEPRLMIEEVQDQAALPSLRRVKPLIY